MFVRLIVNTVIERKVNRIVFASSMANVLDEHKKH
jgi:hypothetical protein